MTATSAIIAYADQLPPMPGVITQLLSAVDDPSQSARTVSDLIRVDPALSAATLKLANSAAYRPTGDPVTAIERALVLIGLEAAVRLALSQAGKVLGSSESAGYGLDQNELWFRSIRCGVAAQELARETRLVNPSTAYATGLLLDVGKLAMGRFIADAMPEILQSAVAERNFATAEEKVLGVSHAEIGAHIVETMGLPDALVEAIRFHHGPREDSGPLTWIAHIADTIALSISAPGADGLLYGLHPDWANHVPMDESSFERTVIRTCALAEPVLAALAGS